MRKWLTLLTLAAYFATTLAAAFFLPVGAQAQGGVRFSAVEIDLWPEFDRPAVLVIEHLTLSSDVVLPAELTVRIPAQATVNAVASKEVGGALVNVDYDQQIQGDWAVISLSVTTRDIQIEYYDALIKQGAARHYSYLWPGDYAVDSFAVQFQMPVEASDLQAKPAFPNSSVGADGLTYYTSEFGSLAAEQTFTLEVTYQKATDTLSAPSLNVQPAENPANATGRVTLTQYIPWVLGILGIVLILFGLVAGVLYWQGRWRDSGGVTRQRHALRREKTGEPTEVIHCHQCGRRAQPGDLFCRACGTRLRHGEQ
jgi:hypothetical protein